MCARTSCPPPQRVPGLRPAGTGGGAHGCPSLREAVRALPEELRSVIVLRYFTGLTLEETAAALEIPRGTVSSRQRRALELSGWT